MEEKDEHGPYDGIFFRIEETEDKTIIRFVSLLLFKLMLNKMQSDFQLPTDVHVYRLNTRKQKVKCHIILNAVTNSIEVSEAGRKAWKEEFLDKTIPSLLSQLVVKTNKRIDLDESINEDEIQDSQLELVNVAVSDSYESKQTSKVETHSNEAIINTLNELKTQIQQIREERSQTKKTYASVVSTDSKKSATPASSSSKKTPVSTSQQISNQGNTTNIVSDPNQSNLSVINECAPATGQNKSTSNPSVINQRATAKPMTSSSDSVGRQIPTIRKNVLLAGDSIINRVNPKGLKYNVHKHAIPGATVKTLMTEVQLFDLCRFDTIIVYVGGNDIAHHRDIELIEEHYDQFVAILRTSNPNLRVILSKVAPRGDVDVSPLNSAIERLCIHHKLDSVDIFRAFHDKNGMICMRYINHQDAIHPSASGIKRVVGTINSTVDIVHSFDSVVFSPVTGRKPFNANVRYNQRQNVIRLGHTKSHTCLKCGETNHETSRCRHQSPITCWACGNVGHKQGHCETFK